MSRILHPHGFHGSTVTPPGHHSPWLSLTKKAKPKVGGQHQLLREVIPQSQFPQLQGGDNNSVYFIGWLSGVNKKMHINLMRLSVKCAAHNNP